MNRVVFSRDLIKSYPGIVKEMETVFVGYNRRGRYNLISYSRFGKLQYIEFSRVNVAVIVTVEYLEVDCFGSPRWVTAKVLVSDVL